MPSDGVPNVGWELASPRQAHCARNPSTSFIRTGKGRHAHFFPSTLISCPVAYLFRVNECNRPPRYRLVPAHSRLPSCLSHCGRQCAFAKPVVNDRRLPIEAYLCGRRVAFEPSPLSIADGTRGVPRPTLSAFSALKFDYVRFRGTNALFAAYN